MEKNRLISVIDRYHLNGVVESVKWSIKDKNITIDFITPFKNLVGKITSSGIELDDSDIGIYDTSQFYKLIKIMDNTIVMKVNKSERGTPLELTIADNQYDLNYYLSDLNLIETVPNINEPDHYDAEATIDSSFISMFVNAKKALGDIKRFTIQSELTEGTMNLLITIGDGSGYANKIKFKTVCEAMFGLKEVPFPADIMLEILKANEDSKSGKLEISEGGLMKISFTSKNDIESVYYLVRLSEN